MRSVERVGFVGVGQIGSRIARHVLKAGYPLAVYDVRSEAMQALTADGARACSSPAEVAARSDLVCVVVLDDAQAESALLGAEGIVQGAEADTLVALHSTLKIPTVEGLARSAAEQQVHVIDAGVAGGYHNAEIGELVVMVGGAAEQLERARPVFDCYAREVVHGGALGTGMALKLIKNHISYTVMASAHEGALYAEELGVEAEIVRRVVSKTDLLDQFFHPMLARTSARRHPIDAPAETLGYATKFTAMAHKDLDAIELLAREIGVDLPMGRAARHTAARYFQLPEELEDSD